jgi:acyl carrier protein
MENFLLGDDLRTLPGDASLIEAGIIDSTGVLELVGFLERTYGLRIADHELVPENLDSIDRVVRFVESKRSASAYG